MCVLLFWYYPTLYDYLLKRNIEFSKTHIAHTQTKTKNSTYVRTTMYYVLRTEVPSCLLRLPRRLNFAPTLHNTNLNTVHNSWNVIPLTTLWQKTTNVLKISNSTNKPWLYVRPRQHVLDQAWTFPGPSGRRIVNDGAKGLEPIIKVYVFPSLPHQGEKDRRVRHVLVDGLRMVL